MKFSHQIITVAGDKKPQLVILYNEDGTIKHIFENTSANWITAPDSVRKSPCLGMMEVSDRFYQAIDQASRFEVQSI